MYMKFDDILYKLLTENYALEHGPFSNNGDLVLSVVNDSLDLFSFTVESVKYKTVIGTIEITKNTGKNAYGSEVQQAIVKSDFFKVKNKDMMLRAKGLVMDAIIFYMSQIQNKEDQPNEIKIMPRNPVDKRIYKSREFADWMYANTRKSSDVRLYQNYYTHEFADGSVGYLKYNW